MTGPGGYRERPARLPGAVVWTRTVDPAAGPAAPVLPDGCMDLLWVAGELRVAGPDTRAHHPAPDAVTEYAGIRFAPGAAPTYLGVPAHELRDQGVALADLWPAARVRRLAERITESPDRAAELEAVALRLVRATGPPDPLLSGVVRTLREGATVAETARRSGLNPRLLHRRSLTAFGYGPKTLARILRLQRALALARAGTPLAETAVRAGYTDQAHLARDVRDLTGSTLTRLL
ncbi:helix-turn-helix domain-containing protein [Streptomyces sp. VRA16 Mangrove soil]|uniref:helix-turn-helix domain-containing protein n=1 Tax=Streptomyces sp. VRA16 Mangrove soil TaxID=2817434 RepID=UPI001A9F93F1|nr:helix-turn-helix domain-containing protein [Streptomyces sp. VRA16 Mangrove soil]MBO1335456.1 helix-turn-helix domain-containing protein [Streptomyces sp. VRA16 Mangrove soil]